MGLDGRYDTKIEAEFSHACLPALARLGLPVTALRHDDVRHVLYVDIALPARTPRADRRQALDILREFEDRYADAVTVEPAYVPVEEPAATSRP